MNTNRFAQALLNAIKEFLTWIGLPREILDTADEIIFLILIVAIAFICRDEYLAGKSYPGEKLLDGVQ